MRTIVQGERGYTSVREQNGLLYVGLPRQVSGGKQRHLSTGLQDTLPNIEKARKLCKLLDTDIERNDFDITLERYRPKHKRQSREIKPKIQITLTMLYAQYSSSKKEVTSPSTHKSVYQNNLDKITQCPCQTVLDARGVAQWLLTRFTRDSARRTLVQVNAAIKWGMGTGLIPIENNPYPSVIKNLQGKSKKKKKIEYYSNTERDLIIDCGYRYSADKYSVNAEILELLFLTGLRWSEAIALNCDDWNGEKLTISKAVVIGLDGAELKQGLKREDERIIGIVPRAVALLDEIVSTREGLMFPSERTGTYLQLKNYSMRFFLPALALASESKPSLPVYSLYSARRTFISLALKSGYSVEDVANLAGNSSLVIYNNYAGVTKDLVMRDF
jgi:integrase